MIGQQSTFRFVHCGLVCRSISFICIQPFQFQINGCDIFFDRFIPEMDLFCGEMFVFTAEFVLFKQRQFMLLFLIENIKMLNFGIQLLV